MGLKGMPMRLEPIANPSLARRAGFPAMALAATVLVASVLALIAGANPFATLGQILTGAVGSGKTHVALGLAILTLGIGGSAFVTTLGELLLSIRSSYQREVERSEAELLEHVCTVDLLVLDDLGIEKPTDWAKERLAYIVNRRYSRKRATIVTTNLALDELEKRWDGRVMSRLYGSCQAVGFSSVADYRRVQRQEYLEVVAAM